MFGKVAWRKLHGNPTRRTNLSARKSWMQTGRHASSMSSLRRDFRNGRYAVIDLNITSDAINRASDAGIPVVTFDSDAPDTQRFAHIGTNNFELGHSFAWLLSTLGRRSGGNYAIISSEAPNLDQRISGIRYKLEETFDSKWKEIRPPTDCRNNDDVALDQMYELASDPDLDAIVSVGGWPMWVEPATRCKAFVDSNKHLLLFIADAAPVQIDLINQGYGDALVGQKPYDIGELIIQTLATRNEKDLAPIDEEFIWTGERIFLKSESNVYDAASAAFDGWSTVVSQVFVAGNIVAFFIAACWLK